jgi:hypothetical protein
MGHTTDKRLEHAEHTQHAAHDPFDRKVATSMAILAAILAGVTLASHRGHTETLRLATEADTAHTRASDQWNLYQAKNIRSHEFQAFLLTEMQMPRADTDKQNPLAEAGRNYWISQISKYEGPEYWSQFQVYLEKLKTDPKAKRPERAKNSELQKEFDKAESIVEDAKKFSAESHRIHVNVDWIDAGHLGLELALVLCSVAVLTKMRSFWLNGLGVGVIGAGLALYGVLGWFVLTGGGGGHH